MVVAVPSQPGTHVTGVVVLIVIVGAFGAVNWMVVVPVQAVHLLAPPADAVFPVQASHAVLSVESWKPGRQAGCGGQQRNSGEGR